MRKVMFREILDSCTTLRDLKTIYESVVFCNETEERQRMIIEDTAKRIAKDDPDGLVKDYTGAAKDFLTRDG